MSSTDPRTTEPAFPVPPSPRPRRTRAAVYVAAVVAVVAVLGVGSWLILNNVSGKWPPILVTVGFFFVVSFAIAAIGRAQPELALATRVAFLVVAIGAGGFYVWDQFLRSKSEKNEQVEQADVKASDLEPGAAERGGGGAADQNVELATGEFSGANDYSTEGKVSLIQVAGGEGQRLVFEDFEADRGPDLKVYLVESADGELDGDRFEDLGDLKAEKGRFQYELDDLDTGKYKSVVIWCAAITDAFGIAPLKQS